MALKQFSGNYIPEIDRLIFKISTTEDQEFQFFLTRRITALILSGAQLKATKIIEKKHPGSATKELLKFKQEQIKNLNQPNQKFKHGSKKPLGNLPSLVTSVNFSNGSNEKICLMSLTTKLHGNIQLHLPESSLHAIQQLLFQLQEIANWGLEQEKTASNQNQITTTNQIH